MSNLKGKVVLVTGATRGVGKGIAIALGEAGATVYITGRSLESSGKELSGSLAETQTAIEEVGGKCIPVQVDHSDDEQVRQLFDRIQTEQKQLDLLVNNVFSGVRAIRDAYGKPFWQAEPELWDTINNVGLRSHYVASIYAARLMSKQNTGIICTISSWGGLSYIFGAAYGAGKSACDRLSSDMAEELKPDNIASISIWPGIVGTEQLTDFATETDTNTVEGAWADGYNWETPLLTGRAIAALASDPNVMEYTGKMQIVAELAEKYNLVDRDGNRPVSLRSLRFVLPFAIPAFRKYAKLIPNLKLPWILLLWGMLRSPKIH
ncbi:SDR family NAD(P)-dependent oxidoreductase [Waterburya agarophytonicola K14]|uniref:SDR family NAD(P)-dependent oxidoreductase n=1 Tax=Waterburya agarophytonicola KI4 TaxID=2874699 RepID=A0A964BN91_9CYAN|nr:SDR family NAD(P)-dependent oxidoreductase [Waterburya agarophytonicola]MCC0176199.1 SDR family NAD(P)-dependent oxidoreductase [Waterburya agarophytonicola KI4]